MGSEAAKTSGRRSCGETRQPASLHGLQVARLARVRKAVTRSPVDELDPSELPRPRPALNQLRLDEEELDALVRYAPETYRAAVALLAYTGARVSEVLALSAGGTWTSLTWSCVSSSNSREP